MELKFSKPDFKYLGQVILTWTFLNITLNMIGLWINKIITKANFEYLADVFTEFVVPLLFQTIIFSICIIIGYSLIKNKKYANFLFVAFQFLVFNIIFLLNLKFTRIIHFETTWDNLGLLYLSYNGQYLIDIMNIFAPLKGKFDGNIFRPLNSGVFYMSWVVLTTIYFLFVTLLTFPILKFMRKK